MTTEASDGSEFGTDPESDSGVGIDPSSDASTHERGDDDRLVEIDAVTVDGGAAAIEVIDVTVGAPAVEREGSERDAETSHTETSHTETSDPETSRQEVDRSAADTVGAGGATDSHGDTEVADSDWKSLPIIRTFVGWWDRVVAWWQRPWTTERSVKFFLGTLPALVIPTLIMVFATQLFGRVPVLDSAHQVVKDANGNQVTHWGSLVFANNTPTGGDFGAHVWGPAYLWEHVLKGGWYNGWSMDWYAGFPAYRFYMVVPAVMMLIANVFLPYGIAMKLVSILGVLTIPIMCWAFGRLANFRYPVPEVFAFAGLAFVLDDSWSIFGGNLKSTMAGEFSFSIALALGILGLGLYARGLQTGRFKVRAAVVLALACVSHGLVLIFVALAALIMSIVWAVATWFESTPGESMTREAKNRLIYIGFVGVATILLAAWWVLPFVGNHDYMTDMKYTPEPARASFDNFWEMYFPLTTPLDILLTTLTVIGFIVAIARRQLNAISIGLTYLMLALLVYATSGGSLPFLGLLWNPRLLPFFYLCRNLLAAYGAIELLSLGYNFLRDRRARTQVGYVASTVFSGVVTLSVLVVLAFMYQVSIGNSSIGYLAGTRTVMNSEKKPISQYYFGPFAATETNARAAGDSWARYNFLGYEGNENWPEYSGVVNTMADLGVEYGCGRAQWENHKDNGQYGTTMALMLLPYWTDSCIGSMEGLFFEASGTTPYHFLSTGAMSEKSSNPVRGLRYVNNDVNIGVRELQALGVKYTMLRSDAAKAQADTHPELTKVADSGPWSIYLVDNSDVVVPLAVQPVVVNERPGDRRERMLELGTSWFQNPDAWAAMPATDGPPNWQRIDVTVDQDEVMTDENGRQIRVEVVEPVDEIKVVTPDPVSVSNVEIRNQSLGFDVDQIGTPIEVKVSYFPNWKVDGAEGPYRIGPNMMVVVPTSTHVEMSYGRSGLDYFSVLLTIAGIALCVFGWRKGDLPVTPMNFGATADLERERRERAAASAMTASFRIDLAVDSGRPGARRHLGDHQQPEPTVAPPADEPETVPWSRVADSSWSQAADPDVGVTIENGDTFAEQIEVLEVREDDSPIHAAVEDSAT